MMKRRKGSEGAARKVDQKAGGDWLELLREAHVHYAGEEFGEAARLYEILAHQGAEAEHPTAFRLYLQAGRAAIFEGESFRGTELMLRGLKLLALDGETRRLELVGGRLVDELRGRGLIQPAQRVTTWLASGGIYSQEGALDAAVTAQAAPPVRLPEQCPACAGTVAPVDLEWADAQTAQCEFCGSPLRGEPL